MHPRLVTIPAFDLLGRHLGPVTLHTYGVLLAAAFLAGLWMAMRLARQERLDPDRVADLAVYVLIAGLVGAKVLLLIVDWPYVPRSPRELLSLAQSGGVFYGGFLAALPVAWWYTRKHRLPAWRTADVLSPGVALGQAIGRLGCFAAGCCFGRTTGVPWAVTFHDPDAARTAGTPIGIPLHPTQLYESGTMMLLVLFLLWLGRRKRFDGQIVLSYVLLYSVARFVNEFYRGDPARGTVFGGWLSTSQFIGVLLVLGVVLVWPYVMRRGRTEPTAA